MATGRGAAVALDVATGGGGQRRPGRRSHLAARASPDARVVAAATVVRSVGGAMPVGEVLNVGDRIATGAAEGLALRLSNADSLRLDENTTVEIVSKNRFVLGNGRVYADTGEGIYRDTWLVIDTEMGVVTDVGTQFAVSIAPDALDVAVREGRVDVRHENRTIVTVAGERLALTQGEAPAISKLAPHDEWWNWTNALVPAFDLENQSLLDFLRWVSRETGRELVFEHEEPAFVGNANRAARLGRGLRSAGSLAIGRRYNPAQVSRRTGPPDYPALIRTRAANRRL